MARNLTKTEIKFLQPIFGGTLPYLSIVCAVNVHDVGGVKNSITPAGRPYFSKGKYCEDFSAAHFLSQWTFVHEMVHVWQWHHDMYPALMAAGAYISNGGVYDNAYPYQLKSGSKLADFNLEQQASIVADYWALTSKYPALYNKDLEPSEGDYSAVMDELRKSGRPVRHSTMDEGWTRSPD